MPRPRKVALDLRVWGENPSGLKKFVDEFLSDLIKLLVSHKYHISAFVSNVRSKELLPPDACVEIYNVGVFGFKSTLACQILCLNLKPDIIFSPFYMAPFWFKAKRIQIVHDLCFLETPNYFPKYRKILVTIALQLFLRSSLIVTVSRATQAAVKRFGFDSIQFYNPVSWSDGSSGVGDENEFDCFFIVSDRPNKRIDRVLDIISCNPDLRFCLISPRMFVELDYLKNLSNVEIFINISESEKKVILSKAGCLVVTSCCEGFFYPLFESLDGGNPVIAPRESVFQEFEGLCSFYDADQLNTIRVAILESANKSVDWSILRTTFPSGREYAEMLVGLIHE